MYIKKEEFGLEIHYLLRNKFRIIIISIYWWDFGNISSFTIVFRFDCLNDEVRL